MFTEGIPAAVRDGVWPGDTPLRSRSGRVVPVSQMILAHTAPNVRLEFLSAIVRDISQRKQMEEALRASLSWQEHIQQNLPLALYVCEPFGEFRVTWVSQGIERVSGFTPAEFLEQQPWADRLHPDDRERVFREVAAVFEAGEVTHEHRWRRRDGEYRWFSDHVVLVRDAEGRPKELRGLWRDITTRKQAERALAEALAFNPTSSRQSRSGSLPTD